MTTQARDLATPSRWARTRLLLARDVQRSNVAMVVGLVVGFGALLALPDLDRWAGWELYFWNVLVTLAGMSVVYAPLTALAFAGLSGPRLRAALESGHRAERRAWSTMGSGAVSWSLMTSIGALGAGVALARNLSWMGGTGGLVLGVLLVASAWLTMVTAYAVHYARRDAFQGGLEFPGDDERAFSDYVYLAVGVSTAFTTSDVDVTSRPMRRTVAGNAVVAFAFNSVIIAMVVTLL